MQPEGTHRLGRDRESRPELEAETSPENTWLWSRIATARPATWPTLEIRKGRSPQVHMR